MTTSVHSVQSTSRQTIGRLAIYSLIMPISIITFLTIHESTHLIVGRALGLPAHFLTLSSVGLDPAARIDALQASPVSLAIMMGVAPCLSILIGVASFLAVVTYSRRWPDLPKRFLTWWALFGIPYAGTQLIFMGIAVSDQDRGNDFPEVALYLHWPHWLDVTLAVSGLVLFMVSCLWLRLAVASADDTPSTTRLQLRLVPTLWRRILALVLGVLLVGSAITGTIMLARDNRLGTSLFELCAFVLWPVIAALLLPWRTSGATLVRNHWLIPGAVGCLIMFMLGILFTGTDYSTMALTTLPQLFIVAWAQAAATSATAQPFSAERMSQMT